MVKWSQRGQTRRRLATGEAKRGGAVRVSPTGYSSRHRWALRLAGSEPRQVVLVVGLGVAGNGAGDVFGGGRSSGELEPVARKHGEAHELVRWVPGSVVKLVDRVAQSLGCRNLVGDELRGGACG